MMSSTIWRPWKDNRTKGKVKAENQHKVYMNPAVSDEVQQLVLNCYNYFCKSIPKKQGALIEAVTTTTCRFISVFHSEWIGIQCVASLV